MLLYIFIAICVVIFIGCIIRVNISRRRQEQYPFNMTIKEYEQYIEKLCYLGILTTGLILFPMAFLMLFSQYKKFMKHLNTQNKYKKH